MEMITQDFYGMPVYGWVVLVGFFGFIISRIVRSKRRRSGRGSGGSGGGGGNQTHRH